MLQNLPFTEPGALEAANVLKSKRAVAMTVSFRRVFVQMREHIATITAVRKRPEEMDETPMECDDALRVIWKDRLKALTRGSVTRASLPHRG